jgi:ribonucleoside-diphosphate reductase alpha chain
LVEAEHNRMLREAAVHTLKRPEILFGSTQKLKWNGSNVYVTLNDYQENGKKIPFEIFINSKEMIHFQWTVALTRMISAVFRRGGDVSFVSDELKSVFDPNGGAFVGGKYVPSFIALLGMTLENHLKAINYTDSVLPPMEFRVEQAELPVLSQKATMIKPAQCPQCKEFSLVSSGACPTCSNCGYSKCS